MNRQNNSNKPNHTQERRTTGRLSRRSKVILASSIILAILVLAGLIANFKVIPAGSPIMIVYIVLILISLSSVPLVYWMRIRKNKYEKLLTAPYSAKYEMIKEIIAQSMLSASLRKDIINDVLDMLVSAQEGHTPAEEVITDINTFTSEIIEAYARRKPTWWRILPDSLIYLICFILGSHTLLWLEDIQQSWFDIQISISMVIFFILVSFILIPVLLLKSFQLKSWVFVLPIAAGILFVLTAELLRRFAMGSAAVRLILDGDFRMIPHFWILLVMVALIPCMVMLKIYLRKPVKQP